MDTPGELALRRGGRAREARSAGCDAHCGEREQLAAPHSRLIAVKAG
jgi:hypothetical protein